MSILDTNARAVGNAEGDLVGYEWPEGEPAVTYKFVSRAGSRDRFDTVDELIYRLDWPDGTWAEMATPPRGPFHKSAPRP